MDVQRSVQAPSVLRLKGHEEPPLPLEEIGGRKGREGGRREAPSLA